LSVEHRTHSQCAVFALLDTKFFDVRIKYELFAGNQGNARESAVKFVLFSRDALDKGVTFEQGRPNGRKIVSLAYQPGALAREIVGSLLGHFHRPIRYLLVPPPTKAVGCLQREFAIFNSMRNKEW
jgi:hypothetical protein